MADLLIDYRKTSGSTITNYVSTKASYPEDWTTITPGGISNLFVYRRDPYVPSDMTSPTRYAVTRSNFSFTEFNFQQDKYFYEYPPYDVFRRTWTRTNISVFESLTGPPITFSGIGSKGSFNHAFNWAMVGTSRAKNQFLTNFNKDSLDMGALIVELGDTVSYLSSHVVTLVQFGKAIATGRFNKAVRMLGISKRNWARFAKRPDQSVASRWLEYRFAILPLANDIEKMASLYNDPLSVLRTLRLVCSGTSSDNVSVPVSYYDGRLRSGKCNYQYKTRYSCTYTVHDPDVVARKALGLDNAPAALWEGVPFSWLSDYVVSIGDFLGALGATRGFSFVHGFRSTKITQDVEFTYEYESLGPYTDIRIQHQGGSVTTGYCREVIDSFPTPTLEFVLQDITLKQLSYTAALISLFTKSKL